MLRQFCTLLLASAFAIAVGGMACGSTVNDPDDTDEGDGAT